jgi:hypothetical protein
MHTMTAAFDEDFARVTRSDTARLTTVLLAADIASVIVTLFWL